jgi:hypothetical protein
LFSRGLRKRNYARRPDLYTICTLETTDQIPGEPSESLDERKFLADTVSKQRELDLREREVAAKEREIKSKEEELARSRWLNPLLIGILVAAIGLISSVVVASLNNAATQKLERQRAQSTIILETIRTGTGNTDASCKNLVFMANLHLIDDPDNTIHKQCASVPEGIPSLPTASSLPFENQNAENSKVADAIRKLKNPKSSLQFGADLTGDCQKTGDQQYACKDGDKVRIEVKNTSSELLYMAAVDVGPSNSVVAVIEHPVIVQPNAVYVSFPLEMSKPFGVDTFKIFASKEPFDVNLFFKSLRKGIRGDPGPVPQDGDWGVIDLIVETRAKSM